MDCLSDFRARFQKLKKELDEAVAYSDDKGLTFFKENGNAPANRFGNPHLESLWGEFEEASKKADLIENQMDELKQEWLNLLTDESSD